MKESVRTEYQPKAYEAVRIAIDAAGTAELSAVALTLEDNVEKMVRAWGCLKNQREKSIKCKVFKWIEEAGILKLSDLERLIELVSIPR